MIRFERLKRIVMAVNPCLKGSLQEYIPSPTKPWNERRAIHLYNRLCNGGTPQQIKSALANSPGKWIDFMFDAAQKHPYPGEIGSGVKPVDYTYRWKNQLYDDEDFSVRYYKFLELVYMWISGMITEGLRHKLVLFWSNHFVTSSESYGLYPTWAYQYYRMLHQFALGTSSTSQDPMYPKKDFKEFVKAIGRTPAMLHYLDGRLNTVRGPNENYAREILELFTMGEGHYTQTDITQLTRCFTGWTLYRYNNNRWEIYPNEPKVYLFYPYNHDYKEKRIFGQTINAVNTNGLTEQQLTDRANSEYDRVHDIIFNARPNEIAKRICTKLYQFYMYQNPPQEIIDELAAKFISSNWEIVPVLKLLFKSEHFFEESSMSTLIKSHFDNIIHVYRSLGLEPDRDYFKYLYDPASKTLKPHEPNPNYKNTLNRDSLLGIFHQTQNLGQELFDPVNVAGWPGYRSWLNEFALVNRWKHHRDHFGYYLPYAWTREKYRDFLKAISNNSKDPHFIVQKLIQHFFTIDLSPDVVETAVNIFKAPVPANYFIDGTWSLDFELGVVSNQFINTMNYLVTLPEFNLL